MKKVIIILTLFNFCQFSYSRNKTDISVMDGKSCLALREKIFFSDTIPLNQQDTLIITQNDSLHLSRHNDTLPLYKDTVPLQQIDTMPLMQTDTIPLAQKDTLEKPQGKTPRGAVIRSAIIPGWGQIYNGKYWKLPLVYGALGATGYIFFDNIKFYNKIRFAYTALINNDTASFANVAPELMPFIEARDIASLRLNRNAFRKNIDYSVLFFLFFWGLNVLDATVDAHLKGFNVSDDLSLKIKPLLNTNSAGFSLVLDIHKGRKKMLFNNNDL